MEFVGKCSDRVSSVSISNGWSMRFPAKFSSARSTERFSETFRERQAIGIQELAIDHQCVLLPINDRQSQFQIWQDPTFDAAWIKEHREPPIIRIPEFFGHEKS